VTRANGVIARPTGAAARWISIVDPVNTFAESSQMPSHQERRSDRRTAAHMGGRRQAGALLHNLDRLAVLDPETKSVRRSKLEPLLGNEEPQPR
jgi:hypothetical protein